MSKTDVSTFVDYGEYSGAGFDDATQADFLTPYIKLMQSGSPEVAEGIAKAGQFYNTATGEVFDELVMVPSVRQHAFVEWRSKDQGGGVVATHSRDDEVVLNATKDGMKLYNSDTGNEIVETFYFFGIQVDGDDILGHVVFPLTSTKIKAYRTWFTRASAVKGKPPMFAHKVKITSFLDTPKKPGVPKFQNVKIEPANGNIKDSLLDMGSDLFEASREFHDMIGTGSVKVDIEKAHNDEEAPF